MRVHRSLVQRQNRSDAGIPIAEQLTPFVPGLLFETFLKNRVQSAPVCLIIPVGQLSWGEAHILTEEIIELGLKRSHGDEPPIGALVNAVEWSTAVKEIRFPLRDPSALAG